MHYLIAFALTLSFPASTIFSSASSAGNAGLFLAHESIGKTALSAVKPAQEAAGSSIMDDDSLIVLYQRLNLMKYELSYDVFRYGMTGYNTLLQEGKLTNKNLLTIIDFTKPSTAKRFYTIDLAELKVKFHTYVSHGRNTGDNEATSFSNTIHSNQSSLGFFMTGETYVGSKGYSLKLDGLEEGYNTNARERAVVIHEADYVSETWIRKYGRLGRSQGCPALPKGLSKEIINVIKNQTLVFAYYHDKTYLQHSAYLHYLEQFISNNTVVTPGLGVNLQ